MRRRAKSFLSTEIREEKSKSIPEGEIKKGETSVIEAGRSFQDSSMATVRNSKIRARGRDILRIHTTASRDPDRESDATKTPSKDPISTDRGETIIKERGHGKEEEVVAEITARDRINSHNSIINRTSNNHTEDDQG